MPTSRHSSPHTSVELPPSVTFALWFSAWAAGTASLDAARDAVAGDDTAHDLVGLPDREEPVPLILGLGLLRTEGGAAAYPALPVPGDPLGLGGPAEFNAAAIETGEAVVVPGADIGLVPQRVGPAVQWVARPVGRAGDLPDLDEADGALRHALLESADRLADLDVARWRPDVADALMELRRGADLHVPPSTPGRALRVLALASRCRAVVELALEDDGNAVTAREAESRRAALLPLDRAARRGLVAAGSLGAG